MSINHRIVLLCLSIPIFFNGCYPTLGYRPGLPSTFTSISTCDSTSENVAQLACKEKEFYTIVKWGEETAQAYTTKALINEWSVYAAGAVGIIGGVVLGTLAATDQGNTDAAKITPLVTAAVASLLALNQNDDKAAAYGESIIAIEESQAAAERHVSRNKNQNGFQHGSEILKDSIRQEIVNLDIRMVAIRKKMAASIPTTTALVPQSFTEATAKNPLSLTLFTQNLETDPEGLRVITAPNTAVTIDVKNGHIVITLTNPVCQDYLVMLSVKNKLVLPARNLRCEK